MSDTIRTADGSLTLHNAFYGETYHSVNGAVTESRHVFLAGTGIARRLQQPHTVRVLEIGFGLGLNCLLTTSLALEHAGRLDYHALEQDVAAIRRIPDMHYNELGSVAGFDRQIVAALDQHEVTQPVYPETTALPTDRTRLKPIRIELGPGVSLTLHLQDAVAGRLPAGKFDAIYLDAFSPDNNPECWSSDFLADLYSRTARGGILTTYSAKGYVRRALIAAGYTVKKLPGPPGKREMLQAIA